MRSEAADPSPVGPDQLRPRRTQGAVPRLVKADREESRMSRPMSTSLAAALALGCLCGGPAAAQAPGVPRGLADREGIFIDGTTFKIVTGRAPGDAARQVEELGA